MEYGGRVDAALGPEAREVKAASQPPVGKTPRQECRARDGRVWDRTDSVVAYVAVSVSLITTDSVGV